MNSDSKLFAVGWYPFAATGLPTDIQQAAYGNASNLPSVVHIPNLDTILLGTSPRGRCVGCRTRWVVGHVCSPNRKRTCTSPHTASGWQRHLSWDGCTVDMSSGAGIQPTDWCPGLQTYISLISSLVDPQRSSHAWTATSLL